MDIKLYSTCLNPIRYFNRSTKRWMVVPCRTCKACLLQRSNRLKALLNNESAKPHTYPLFITLTYDQKYIPRIYKPKDFGREDIFLCETSPNNGKTLYFNETYDLRNPQLIRESNVFCYTFNKRHIQLWLKRLRKDLFKTFNSYHLFRYFVVSEYGTKTFRPHYHCELFFNSEEVRNYVLSLYNTKMYTNEQYLQKRSKSLLSHWKYGVTDAQIPISTNGVAQYVSGYLTWLNRSETIFDVKALQPWYLCSRKPFIGFDKTLYNDFQVRSKFGLVFYTKFLATENKYATFLYPKSYVSSVYPKCSGFSRSTRQSLSEKYGALLGVLKTLGIITYDYAYNKGMRWHYDQNQVKQYTKLYLDSISISRRKLGKDDLIISYRFPHKICSQSDVNAMRKCLRWCLDHNKLPEDYVNLVLDTYTKRFSWLQGQYYSALNEFISHSDVPLDKLLFDIDINSRYETKDMSFDSYILPNFSTILKNQFLNYENEVNIDYANRIVKHSNLC